MISLEITSRLAFNRSVGRSPRWRSLFLSPNGRQQLEAQLLRNEHNISELRELLPLSTIVASEPSQ